MPFSQSSQLTCIVQFMEAQQPHSILDVGTGMAQYGFLARINLEHVHLFEINGAQGKQRDRSDWHILIDGIDAYAGYRTPVHDYCYNHWWVGDALDLLPDIADNAYELVLAIDILEHFDKADGQRFLTELQRIAARSVLISTPKAFIPQEIEANPYENHRSVWSQAELKAAGFSHTLENVDSWIMVYDAVAN